MQDWEDCLSIDLVAPELSQLWGYYLGNLGYEAESVTGASSKLALIFGDAMDVIEGGYGRGLNKVYH